MMTIKFNKREVSGTFDSFAGVSRAVTALIGNRPASRVGAQPATVHNGKGNQIAVVSYNGKVWDKKDNLIYCPYA